MSPKFSPKNLVNSSQPNISRKSLMKNSSQKHNRERQPVILIKQLNQSKDVIRASQLELSIRFIIQTSLSNILTIHLFSTFQPSNPAKKLQSYYLLKTSPKCNVQVLKPVSHKHLIQETLLKNSTKYLNQKSDKCVNQTSQPKQPT